MSVPGQCIPMSNLGRANPGNRAQLTGCVFSMTFVAFRHLSISVADVMYTSCDFCIRSRFVFWKQFGKAECQNFACLDCTLVVKQRSGKCRQRVHRISVQFIVFLGFYSRTKVNTDQFWNNRG